MSYYNYSDNSGELNGNIRDPRLSSSVAQYQNNVSDSAQAQQSGYNYAGSTNHQQSQYGGQVYPTTDQTYTNIPTTDSSNNPYYPTQSYYSQEYQSTQQNQSNYTTESSQLQYGKQNYDQQQYYQPNVDSQYYQTGQQNQHYVYDLSFPDEVEQENDVTARSDEELWVEAWLARLGKIQIKLDSTVVVTSSKNCSQTSKTPTKHRSGKVSANRLGDARSNLHKAFKVLSSIETIHKHLSDNLSTVSSDEWRQCTVQIGTLRDELSVLIAPFDGENLVCLKRLVNLRKKKRCNEKKKRLTRREDREQRKEHRMKRHEVIDGWLEKENREVQRMQEEEEAKHEADIILSETTRKKLDAKRNLALVQALTKLRDVREKAALGRGEKVSAQDTYAFQNLAERLQDIWTNALKDYGKEEHRLRTQLEQTTSEDQRKAKMERENKVTDDWSRALFGEPLKEGEESGLYLGLTAAERSVDTFIAIRKSWDTFLAKPEDRLGSKIPIGWVLPKEHVSDKWSQYLSNIPTT